MNKNKLIKSGLVYTLGSILVQGLAFITLPIYTRLISQEVFGQFSLYSSWLTLISLFIGLQLSGTLSIAKKKYDDLYDEYVVNILTLSNIVFLVIFTLAYVIRGYLSQILALSSSYVLVLFLQSYMSVLVGFLANYFIQLQKSTVNFALSFLSAIVNVVISVYLIYTIEDHFLARVMGMLIPSAMVSMITLYYFYGTKKITYRMSYMKFALSISIPLIFHHLGHNILNQFDRIMIGKMIGSVDLALYSFGYNIGLVLQIVLHSINMAWVPYFFEERKKNATDLPAMISKYLNLAVFLTLGYLTIFPELTIIMGGDKYSSSLDFTSLIIISYFFVFLYTFPVNIQFYYENTKLIPLGTLTAGLINIGLNFWFIPNYGIYGAALATVISYIVLLLFHHVIASVRYQYKDVTPIKYILLSATVIVYSVVMNLFINSMMTRWFIGLLVLVGFVYKYKDDLMTLYRKYSK